MQRKMTTSLAAMFLTTFGLALIANPSLAAEDAAAQRALAIQGCFGTYDAAPRRPDGHVDAERLLAELADLHANTYHWLVWHAPTDWDDLQRFLPLARQQGISVWVCLVPPSESPPRTKAYSEPFRTDYDRWAVGIAKLSVRESNLVAWSIDDFTHNLRVFTPQRLAAILGKARSVNPKLAFVPCSYFPAVMPRFAQEYRGLFDGLLFPYRHESAGANLTDPGLVKEEVRKIRETIGSSVPVMVDIYATAHSRLGNSTADYVRRAMIAARRSADGVLIYCHQNPQASPEKYRAMKEILQGWFGAKADE